ncbi:hypothetical protein Ancab_016267 [Ancistrocladus abbreviatus]
MGPGPEKDFQPVRHRGLWRSGRIRGLLALSGEDINHASGMLKIGEKTSFDLAVKYVGQGKVVSELEIYIHGRLLQSLNFSGDLDFDKDKMGGEKGCCSCHDSSKSIEHLFFEYSLPSGLNTLLQQHISVQRRLWRWSTESRWCNNVMDGTFGSLGPVLQASTCGIWLTKNIALYIPTTDCYFFYSAYHCAGEK